jgi:predicted house-cleaning noncanonical NTP pyrophosphatase (MazG superfamily)
MGMVKRRNPSKASKNLNDPSMLFGIISGEGEQMIEKVLNKIAEQVLAFDEASLRSLRTKYHERISHFDTSKEWEKAVIVYFIINSVITKNALFNQNAMAVQGKKKTKEEKKKGGQLRVVK